MHPGEVAAAVRRPREPAAVGGVAAPSAPPMLRVDGLVKQFPIRTEFVLRRTVVVAAVDGVSLEVPAGATPALVGESGCGRSTPARTILHLQEPTRGTVELAGRDVTALSPAQHPYTRALFSAVPIPDPAVERARERPVLSGDVPSPVNPPPGCRFRTRCGKHLLLSESDKLRCIGEVPALRPAAGDPGHLVSCHVAGGARHLA